MFLHFLRTAEPQTPSNTYQSSQSQTSACLELDNHTEFYRKKYANFVQELQGTSKKSINAGEGGTVQNHKQFIQTIKQSRNSP